MEKLYTVENIAQMTGLTSRTIRNYIADGRLRGRKIGSQWRFTEADVESLFSQRAAAADTAAEDDLVSEFLKPQQRTCITACSVIDCPATSADAAGALNQIITDHIGVTYPNGEISFSYQYLEEVGAARFIFTGPADYVSKLVKIIRKKG